MFTLSSIIREHLRYLALAAEREIYLPPHNCPGWIMNWSLKRGVWTEQATPQPRVLELQKVIYPSVLTKGAGLIGKALLCFVKKN